MPKINKDCRFFKGTKPCIWNKSNGYECASCDQYQPRGKNILIIKLGAMGDVLRTTCIVPKIKQKFGESYLTWITRSESMELLESNPQIDEVWDFHNIETLIRLQVQKWDLVYNLDNSHVSSALASLALAENKIGFLHTDEGITPTNESAMEWLQMAVFDRLKKNNACSYQEIMYEICGFDAPICRPGLYLPDKYIKYAEALIARLLPKHVCYGSIVGINTGSGSQWPKKMLEIKQIITLTETLLDSDLDCNVLLLGGPNEVLRNEEITAQFSSERVGNIGCNYSVLQFAAIVNLCDVLICGDTLAMHIATALEVPTVAVFGPTSVAEIYDYGGLIEKVSAEELNCLCCYSNCDKDKNCMTLLPTNSLAEKIISRIKTTSEISRR